MSESRRPPRRGRGRRPSNRTGSDTGDNPYRDEAESAGSAPAATSEPPAEAPSPVARGDSEAEKPERPRRGRHPKADRTRTSEAAPASSEAPPPPSVEASAPPPPPTPSAPSDRSEFVTRNADEGEGRRGTDEFQTPSQGMNGSVPPSGQGSGGGGYDRQPQQQQYQRFDRHDRRDRGQEGGGGGGGGGSFQDRRNGRRHRRGRGRGPRRDHQQQQQQQQPQQPVQITATTEMRGWFDPARDAGFLRRAANSYLAEPGDPYVPPHVVRQMQLRRADLVDAAVGFDQRGRP